MIPSMEMKRLVDLALDGTDEDVAIAIMEHAQTGGLEGLNIAGAILKEYAVRANTSDDSTEQEVSE